MGKTNENMIHEPVMAEEVLEHLVPAKGEFRFVDCTLGFGGHSCLVLKKNPDIKVLGIDQDMNAIDYAEKRLSFADDRILIEKGRFSSVSSFMIKNDWKYADFFLLDIGVSSQQIDLPERGFSYRYNGPLDMRMDSKTGNRTAAQILNNYTFSELVRIFKDYGEIKQAGKLAAAVIERRKKKTWFKTGELVDLCEKVLPRPRKSGPPVPSLCFQALRIEVNNELGELQEALKAILGVASEKGRIGVISYHSLEDRIVKNFFRREASDCLCPPGLPECVCDHKP
ncbi:MAG: 16S rRNA (cytosine(1402)-N(4))-methyltransferase RsmH, partial [Victivallales bacterium]|nr:16S rRNA (cytosine(1402)-N(4))-methyltransferase RsmH [Victivallales bacterium]